MRLLRLLTALVALAGSIPAEQLIEGRVWDTTESERVPLANARVTLIARPEPALLGSTRTDSEGRFAFEGEIAGEVRLQFTRNGFLPAAGDDFRNADCAGGCGPFELEMVRAGAITGVLADDLGEPLVRARVLLWCDGFSSPLANAVSDDRGAFRLSGLRPGLDCRVEVAENFRASRTVELGSEAVPVRTEAGMLRSISIAMRQSPAASVQVSGLVQGLASVAEGRRMLFAYQTSSRGRTPGVLRAEVDASGRFAMRDVRPGEYLFRLQTVGAPNRGETLYLGRREILGDLEGLVLTPREPWCFAGRIEFNSSPPLEPMRIFLSSTEARRGHAFIAQPPDFQFEMTRPDAEPDEFRAELRDDSFFITEIEAGGEVFPPWALKLEESAAESLVFRVSQDFAKVQGRVKADSAGAAAAHYRVALRATHCGSLRCVRSLQTDQEGRFSFDKVQPGEYSIAAWAGVGDGEVRGDRMWDEAGAAVRVFPVEAGSEIEIDLTAATALEAF